MYVCMHGIYVCMYACICVYIYIKCTYSNLICHMHTYIHSVHTYKKYICACMHTYMYSRTVTRILQNRHIHTCVYADTMKPVVAKAPDDWRDGGCADRGVWDACEGLGFRVLGAMLQQGSRHYWVTFRHCCCAPALRQSAQVWTLLSFWNRIQAYTRRCILGMPYQIYV